MNSTGTDAGQHRPKESHEPDDGLMKVLSDDWETVRQRKVEIFFFLVIVALILALAGGLDICPSQTRFTQTYFCEGPHRARMLWGSYVGFAILSIVVLFVHDYRFRKSGALVLRHLITGEDFYKILFDGIKNSVLAVALGTTVVHVLKGMKSTDWRTDQAWFAEFVSPSLPLSWFLVGVAISWLVAACLLFAANTGMRCSYYRLSRSIAEKRKLNESSKEIFRHSLLRTFCVTVFYAEFFCFLGVAAYQLGTPGA